MLVSDTGSTAENETVLAMELTYWSYRPLKGAQQNYCEVATVGAGRSL